MAEDTNTLRRKLAVARPPAGVQVETAARIWRIGLARAARDLAGLPVQPDDIRDERHSLAEVLDLLPERGLFTVLEGPGNALGLLCLSPDLVCALVESQTLGAALPAVAPSRRLTRTDAALSASVIDAALGCLDSGLEGAPDLTWAGGFRYASCLEDSRPLALLLEDQPYRSLWLSGVVTGTGRSISALLALPAERRTAQYPAEGSTTPAAPRDPAWTASFTRSLGQAEVDLMAVLARCRVPLETSMSLKPGDLLPLGPADLNALTMSSLSGEELCPVRLGRQGGMRAVKLSDSLAPARLAETEEAPARDEPLQRSA